MLRSEMAVCLGSLYSRYPTKTEVRDATEDFYKAYGIYNGDVFAWVLDQYQGRYFPTVVEIGELIQSIKREQELIIQDPRNPFYAKVSEEAGERRLKKVRRAQKILSALNNTTTMTLQGGKQ